MSRITSVLKSLQQRKALVAYLMTGYPQPDSVEVMKQLHQAGVDMFELGIPFSDPMADGVVIQRAGQTAIERGITLNHVFATVEQFRQYSSQVPVLLMGYANSLEHYDLTHYPGAFMDKARAVGVDGLLLVDYPPNEMAKIAHLAQGLDLIFLLAPTSSPESIVSVAKLATGFVYYVSMRGVTGASVQDITEIHAKVSDIRQATALPILVGFGIREPQQAQQVAACADGVVIGSRLIELLEEGLLASNSDPPYYQLCKNWVQTVRQLLD
ncbi:MAG: tryptophan synthase subunit alpha [Gammaproteobacteria bacterium]|nr:tryptophan synthase subunit alpha [Gammaproteobacteria bacterium]